MIKAEEIKKGSFNTEVFRILIDTSINRLMSEMQRKNLIRANTLTPLQKTERLLYSYNDFTEAIHDKEKQIEDIKKLGVPQKSKSITRFTDCYNYTEISEEEKAIEMIKDIEKSIENTRKYIKIIDNALDKIRDDRYYDIINLKYFKGLSGESIAEQLQIDVSTVSRNKNKLVNKLKIILFSDESIKELFQ